MVRDADTLGPPYEPQFGFEAQLRRARFFFAPLRLCVNKNPAAPSARPARWSRMPSTAIARFAYRPALRALDVQFVGGRVYRYFDMPEAVAQALARSGSKGGYFNRAIRDRYRFERLPRWEDAAADSACDELQKSQHK